VVYCETIGVEGRPLSASLTTLALAPECNETKLKCMIQLASLIGEDMVRGHEAGNNASLDSLVEYLSDRAWMG
jgi:hypothetical protein